MPPRSPHALRALLIITALAFTGCGTTPTRQLHLAPESPGQRELQTRTFFGVEANELAAACAGTLQDLGFVADESNVTLGVFTGSKGFPIQKLTRGETAAVTVVAVAGLAFLALNPHLLLMGALMGGGGSSTPPPKPEQIRVMVVITPSPGGGSDTFLVRATFEQVLATPSGNQSRVVSAQPMNTPELYDDLFRRLDQNLPRERHTL